MKAAPCLVGLRGELLDAGLVVAEEGDAEVLRVVVGAARHLPGTDRRHAVTKRAVRRLCASHNLCLAGA